MVGGERSVTEAVESYLQMQWEIEQAYRERNALAARQTPAVQPRAVRKRPYGLLAAWIAVMALLSWRLSMWR